MTNVPIASIKVEDGLVTMFFRDGRTVEGRFADLPDAQRAACGDAGLANFLRTSYGNSANVDEAYTAALARLEGLKGGKWLPNTRLGGPRKEPDDLARAVMEAQGITLEQ